MKKILEWINRHLSNHQLIILVSILAGVIVVITTFGDMIMPVLAGIVVAYLLEGMVNKLEKFRSRRTVAVIGVWFAFMASMFSVILVLVPILYEQFAQFLSGVPQMISQLQVGLLKLPEKFPNFITEIRIRELLATLKGELGTASQRLLTTSMLTSLINVTKVMIYIVVMPIIVFFLLKDKTIIIKWFTDFLPKERDLLADVWKDIDQQLANYIRGKFIEIVIVWAMTYVILSVMNVNYAMMLGVLVGLSVIIPYVGAVVVTFPVAIIAFFQFGWTTDFGWVMFAYGMIQTLDGNVLVPLLFSEVVSLHPIAIILAILVFGGLWGFWGVFFAIPLATVVQSTIKAWPENIED